jgi:hypothetical protein
MEYNGMGDWGSREFGAPDEMTIFDDGAGLFLYKLKDRFLTISANIK